MRGEKYAGHTERSKGMGDGRMGLFPELGRDRRSILAEDRWGRTHHSHWMGYRETAPGIDVKAATRLWNCGVGGKGQV